MPRIQYSPCEYDATSEVRIWVLPDAAPSLYYPVIIDPVPCVIVVRALLQQVVFASPLSHVSAKRFLSSVPLPDPIPRGPGRRTPTGRHLSSNREMLVVIEPISLVERSTFVCQYFLVGFFKNNIWFCTNSMSVITDITMKRTYSILACHQARVSGRTCKQTVLHAQSRFPSYHLVATVSPESLVLFREGLW